MAVENIVTYVISNQTDFRSMREQLESNFSLIARKPSHFIQDYYDTFDWRLYQNNLMFVREANWYKLCEILSETPIDTFEDSRIRSCKFWWDFPSGSFRDRLRAIIDVRALLKVINLDRTMTAIHVLNKDDKTVLRIVLNELVLIQGDGRQTAIYLMSIVPLRGYVTEHENFLAFIDSLGFAQKVANPLSAILETLNIQVGSYTSKINIHLDPSMRADVAIKMILRNLLTVLQQNEAGICDDIDTEFLHDFRVSVRRTRSVLSQIKEVFNPELTDRFRIDLKNLGDLTNRMRDLDVYLLNERKYRAILPKSLREGLSTFFEHLGRERHQEHARIVDYFMSTPYKELTAFWQNFVDSPESEPDQLALRASVPIIVLAKELIYERYLKLIQAGQKIGDRTSDAKLHKLRIQCKKLRYLLEFFASLFPKELIMLLMTRLKSIQGILGEYNDYSVQQQKLLTVLENEIKDDVRFPVLAAAMGGLITHLYQEQNRCRMTFSSAFTEFSNPETRQIFEDLFRHP